MGMAGKRVYTDKLGVIICFVFGVGLLFQSSCATLGVAPKTTEPAVSEEKPITPMIFESEEYIIYRLQGDETPVTLAKKFLGDTKHSWVIEEANEGTLFEKGQMIVIPLKEQNKGGLRADGYQAVPILCYHCFAETCKSSTCMPIRIFDKQMRYLKHNNYKVITLSELLDFLNYRYALPKRSVVITLDDGYRSAYDIAYPILKKYGFTATLLIYTDFVGISKSAITWDQLREMKADGFEVGSQTISHCDLTKKEAEEDDKAYIERVKRELLVSKQIIDRELKQNTIYLAFPYGRCDQRIVNMCDLVGYKMAFSVKRGGNPFFADPLNLKRDTILKRDMESFISTLETFYEFSLE
jgi:peptidoglycan/xylan/chitin deacetylase (PgdA/CDA1 family)